MTLMIYRLCIVVLVCFRYMTFRVQIGEIFGSACEQAESGEGIVIEYKAMGTTLYTQIAELAHNGKQTKV